LLRRLHRSAILRYTHSTTTRYTAVHEPPHRPGVARSNVQHLAPNKQPRSKCMLLSLLTLRRALESERLILCRPDAHRSLTGRRRYEVAPNSLHVAAQEDPLYDGVTCRTRTLILYSKSHTNQAKRDVPVGGTLRNRWLLVKAGAGSFSWCDPGRPSRSGGAVADCLLPLDAVAQAVPSRTRRLLMSRWHPQR
jgi:hypothetical protein